MTLPQDWKSERLDQWGTLVSGATPSTNIPSYWDGDIVWVTPADLSLLRTPYLASSNKRITEDGLRSCAARLLPAGCVVLSSRAPIGYVALTTVPFCTNQGCKSIQFNDHIDSLFAYYSIRFNVDKIRQLGEGTTFAEISKATLSTVVVPFPTNHAEQVKIADVLAAADRAIEDTEALVAKRQRIKAGLIADLLTRGVDEHGGVRSPATHAFENSPLGQIPVGWRCERLAFFVPFAEYGISTSLGDSGVPVLRMNNFGNGEADLSDLKYTDARVPESLWLRPGDVLFNRTNSWQHVGRTGIWRGQYDRATFASYLVRLNPHANRLLPELLNFWLNWPKTQIRMRRYATPAVQQVNINPTNLRMLGAAFPSSMEEQATIVDRIQAQNDAIRAEQRTLDKLRALKRGLMQDLLSGRTRVAALLDDDKTELAGVA